MPKDEFDHEDPMELVGMVMPAEPGELEAMAECFIEEYMRLGWNEKRLMILFRSPMFLATHRIYLEMGEARVRELIQTLRANWGNLRVVDPPEISETVSPNCALIEEFTEGDLHA